MRKILAILFALSVLTACTATASADSEITVSGTGQVLVPADTAVVSLGVSATDREVLNAQAKANETIAAIREALISRGISEGDINTDYINIYARYDYSDGVEQLTSYNANSTLAIRVDNIDQVGEVIDTAFGAGANTLNGISFSASDTKEAREEAMRAAVEDAKAKAQILADAAGLQIRGIEEIAEQGTYSSERGSMNTFKAAAEDSAAGTVIQAAKLSVSSTITVTFQVDR
ncbi:MAG: SIMPL domain-containing protein [Oscillospiraceae bacterium]|nr:SIMPL domain-containing protein [Oscillospiraceae bacterium]